MSGGYTQDKPPAGIKEEDVIGWHNMYWKEGQVKICFRPGGHLYCPDPEHQKDATWLILDGEVIIDWKEHGKYILTVDEGKHMKGHVVPKNDDDEKNWRKTLYQQDLKPVEKLLLGDGSGTKWKFQHPKGHFTVEFKANGTNQFVNPCPGEAHWSLSKDNKTVKIDWGKYGQYEMAVDVKKKTMSGEFITNDPNDIDDKYDRTASLSNGDGDHGDGHDDGGRGHSNLVGVDPEVLPDADDKDNGHGHEHGHGHSHGGGHGSGAGIVGIGNVNVGKATFMIDREGQVLRGTETTFGVERVAGEGKGFAGFTAWLLDSKDQQISDKAEGEKHDDHSHFTLIPKAPDAEAFALSDGSQVSKISFCPGASPTEGGIMSVLQNAEGKNVGFIELKLHDDAGDLEMWICKDGAMSQPLDFPASTSITVTFPTHGNRSVTLAVRDEDENKDEDGNPNMREGKMTNYFIFPGESDQDPEFLIGETFRSTTTVTFTAEGAAYTAPPFVLVPHM